MLALENFVEPSHTAAWNWLPLHFSMKENKPPSCLSYYFECLMFYAAESNPNAKEQRA